MKTKQKTDTSIKVLGYFSMGLTILFIYGYWVEIQQF